MPDIHITQKGFEKLFLHLNPNKSNGPDGLSPRLVTELASQIAPVLTKIFKLSLESGEIQDHWRKLSQKLFLQTVHILQCVFSTRGRSFLEFHLECAFSLKKPLFIVQFRNL